jgi:Flp pilus assembly protein TadG
LRPRLRDIAGLFLADRRGAIAAMTAVLATTLVGFGGLAAETAFWYAQKRALQTQADAAALSGAYELLQGQTATTAQTWATHDAVLNGFSNSAPNSIDVSGCTGTACQVTLTLQHSTALASVALPTVTIKARARADIETFSSVACLVVTGAGGVLTVSSNVTAPNCALVVPTSANAQSISISGSPTIGLDTIWTHGGYNAGTATVNLTTPALTFAANGSGTYIPVDPYASSPPNFPVPTNPQSVPAGCPSGTLSPGVYNPMSFQTGRNQCREIDLTPGVYYIVGGNSSTPAFDVQHGARVHCNTCGCTISGSGSGVVIILYPSSNNSGGISVAGQVDLCAPNTNTTTAAGGTPIPAGLLFYQWNSFSANAACNASVTYNPSFVRSNSSANVTGIAYLPCGQFNFQNPSGAGSSLTCFILVAKSATVISLTNTSSVTNCTNKGVPVVSPGGKGAQKINKIVMTQ